MFSCLESRRSLLALTVPAERLAEQGQRSEPLHAAQAGLDVEQGRREPALLLIGRAPVIDGCASSRPL
jgi:hypothetical protein